MAIFADPLASFGWRLAGRTTRSCHLFTDELDLTGLHALAKQIGMKREWFHDQPRAPHYDLTPVRRGAAIIAGAVPVTRREAVAIWRARRAALAEHQSSWQLPVVAHADHYRRSWLAVHSVSSGPITKDQPIGYDASQGGVNSRSMFGWKTCCDDQ